MWYCVDGMLCHSYPSDVRLALGEDFVVFVEELFELGGVLGGVLGGLQVESDELLWRTTIANGGFQMFEVQLDTKSVSCVESKKKRVFDVIHYMECDWNCYVCDCELNC